jgi:hypothetical protein
MHFPTVQDYIALFKKKCPCPGCESVGVPINSCPHSCLRRIAIEYFFFLVGNSIADGFGVDNVSGLLQIDPYVNQV